MFATSLFFSSVITLLSVAALRFAPDDPNPTHPSPIQHTERDLRNITNSPFPSSSLTTTNAIEPQCYLPTPSQPVIHPPDCQMALYNILLSPTTMILCHWDRNSNLPLEFTFQTCSIILARTSIDSHDIFQLVLVAHAAALLVQSCVTPRWGYQGGMARIGVRGTFVVFVISSEARDRGIGTVSATA